MSQSFGRSGACQPLAVSRLPDEWRREDAIGPAACGAARGALPRMPGAPGTMIPGWSGVRAAFAASAGMAPARAARNRQLAQFLGIPETVIREQPEMAEMEYRARLVEQKPRLAGWIGLDRRKAALVYDEPENLLD